ncbi:MAG: hypothetical protein AAFQ82_17700, partial [Myxococcota bacterium]
RELEERIQQARAWPAETNRDEEEETEAEAAPETPEVAEEESTRDAPEASEQPAEVAMGSEPTDEVLDIEARVTMESEDNFWAGLDSESGVFISTINVLPLGQKVHVLLDVEGRHSVNAYGTVRWLRDWDDLQPELHPGMGIELSELDEAQDRIVEDFMSRRDPWLFV